MRTRLGLAGILFVATASVVSAQPQPPASCEDQLKLALRYSNNVGGERNQCDVRNASLGVQLDEAAARIKTLEIELAKLKPVPVPPAKPAAVEPKK